MYSYRMMRLIKYVICLVIISINNIYTSNAQIYTTYLDEDSFFNIGLEINNNVNNSIPTIYAININMGGMISKNIGLGADISHGKMQNDDEEMNRIGINMIYHFINNNDKKSSHVIPLISIGIGHKKYILDREYDGVSMKLHTGINIPIHYISLFTYIGIDRSWFSNRNNEWNLQGNIGIKIPL